MERLIADIKSDFRSDINKNDPKLAKLYKLKGELTKLTTQESIFCMSKKENADWNKQVSKLTEETGKLETEIEEINANKIFYVFFCIYCLTSSLWLCKKKFEHL